jgi:putative intracellular protease/amidase/YHS domain-containing protein
MCRIIALTCLLLVWSSGRAIPAAGDDVQEPRGEVVLKGLDPISLLEGKEVPGVELLGTTRGRFRYLFADTKHKTLFDANPGRYAVQGEMCTMMPTAPASPDLFIVHEGKIFLFGSPACRASFMADPAAFLVTKPRRNVAIFIYEGMELLDFAGPGEVFAVAGQGRAFNVFTVAATSRTVTSQGFVSVAPRYTLADCPKVDVLVVPGGATRIPLADPAAVEWIRKTSRDAEVSLSVCTGAFLLAKAGLLDGLEATTHRSALDALRQAAPETRVLEGRRFVDNGKVVTSAGVSAGIDGSLHVVSRLLGPGAASEAAWGMEYKWELATDARAK